MRVRVRNDGTAEGTTQTFPRSLYGALVTVSDPTPAKSATKAEWVAYAVSKGYARSDAEALTRNDLIERLG
jgi:hypothetical protein